MAPNHGTSLALPPAYASVVVTVLCATAAAGFRKREDSNADTSACGASGGEDECEGWDEKIVKATLAFMEKEEVVGKAELFAKKSSTCYDDIGCFNTTHNMSLNIGGPEPPEKVGTKFFFHSKDTPEGEQVSVKTWDSIYRKKPWDLGKPLVAVVHGFTQSRGTRWMNEVKDALLAIGVNVMVVDWKAGAAKPNYPRAARNTPMPGVQLSLLLQQIINSSKHGLLRQKIHVVGFSLGAQVAGFCGRHFFKTTKKKIGRITGLDPAGPLFDNFKVCLSKEDAEFVDVTHTNAGKLRNFRFGVRNSVGHVDFWPNGGSDQPGCRSGLHRNLCDIISCVIFSTGLALHGCFVLI